MKRPAWNYLIDWTAFVLLTALTATGLLLHFRLPPGSGAASVLGLTRHQWGEVHFWIALPLCTIVLIHLALHTTWIRSLTLGRGTDARRRLRAWAAIAGAIVVVSAVFLLMAWPVQRPAAGDAEGGRHGTLTHGAEGDGAGPAWNGTGHRARARGLL